MFALRRFDARPFAANLRDMSRTQQIIATHDILPVDRSPMDAVRAAINTLTVGPPPVFIAIDALRPYPFRDIGPPHWLLVSVGRDQPSSVHTDWRKVIEAAPPETLVILMSQGEPSGIPREIVQHVDLTGWHGNGSDRRIDAVARRVAAGTSAWRSDDDESDSLRRGALVHVGDGTTMLNPKLLSKITEIGLSAGAIRVLRTQNIIYLGDLVQMTEAELLRIPELGRKRLGEIKNALHELGLVLGATIPGWPPEDMEAALAGPNPVETLLRTPQAPAGEMFRSADDRLAIDPAAGSASDREVGASPVSTQLQETVRRKLETLSSVASRLGNQAGWQGLDPLCHRIADLLDRRGEEVPDVLGSLYGAALELGSYAEMDAAARKDTRSSIEPLDPSAARPLQDVLTSMAPWLRRFPTVRELDDDAGRFLVEQSSARASRDAFTAAATAELIESADAALLHGLLDAGQRGDFIGGKAGRRGILSARNLVLMAASIVGGVLWDGAVSEYASHSVVAARAGAMLVNAENAVLDVAAAMPADVRMAIRRIMENTRQAEPSPSQRQRD